MIKEAIGFGNTVEEAKEDAILKLGARNDEDIQIEIVSLPKKKVLGIFGGCRAEVKVFVERPDKPQKKNKPAKKENNVKQDEQKKETKKAEPKPQKAEKKPEAKKAEPKTVESEEIKAVPASEIPADSKAGKAVAYLNNILVNLGCNDIDIKVATRDNGAVIILEGEGLGVVIGHRGETLDALQHLVSLAAGNGGGYYKVTLNIGDYRQKREQTLVSLAKRMSNQVIRTGRRRTLEPMRPYERRIIHTTVQDIEGVESSSVGEGANRRVVIYPQGGEKPTERSDRGRRGGRDNKNRRPSNTVATAPTREPKRDTDIPLYGKITAQNEE